MKTPNPFQTLLLISMIMLTVLPPTEAQSEPDHTDGILPAKPSPLSAESQQALFQQGKKLCDQRCAKPFAELLGTVDGVPAYSNCRSECIKPEYSFLNLNTGIISIHADNPNKPDLHYIGVTHQCVQYARKWWMINHQQTFGSVDSAYEILYLHSGSNIHDQTSFPLGRSINGSAKRPPKRGDLLIYAPDRTASNWLHGHVAVVVKTELEKGLIYLAEENYSNQIWQKPNQYARAIQVFKIGQVYTAIDAEMGQHHNRTGGQISGWVYPLERK